MLLEEWWLGCVQVELVMLRSRLQWDITHQHHFAIIHMSTARLSWRVRFLDACVCGYINVRVCVSVRWVRNGGLEGKQNMVPCLVHVEVCESVCVAGKVSPLHQLWHTQMLLPRPFMVPVTTQLARSVAAWLLLLLHDVDWPIHTTAAV